MGLVTCRAHDHELCICLFVDCLAYIFLLNIEDLCAGHLDMNLDMKLSFSLWTQLVLTLFAYSLMSICLMFLFPFLFR